MKRRRVFVLASVLLIASALNVHAQSAAEWKTYTSSEGKFTILLPGEPTTGYRPIGMSQNRRPGTDLVYLVDLFPYSADNSERRP